MQTKGILSYLYFQDNHVLIDEISPKNRLGEFLDNESKFMSMSMNKSVTSYILGHAMCDGYIGGLDDRINDWPLLSNSLYENQKIIDTGNILFANLILSGEGNSLYYFDKEGSAGHYDKNGKSIQKALMKTPINGARLSSPFGMRKHPIDGFNKMHRGTDFAAPMGTPIMASGSGTIKKAGWCGGGGNCVVIRHNTTYETIYAHMSKFAKGIKKGVRVKQGQTIGYVGSTGLSTGPHLHYEVIKDGEKVNPAHYYFNDLTPEQFEIMLEQSSSANQSFD